MKAPIMLTDCLTFHLGLDTRKPVYGGLRTTKAQTSDQQVSYLNLVQVKFPFSSYSL